VTVFIFVFALVAAFLLGAGVVGGIWWLQRRSEVRQASSEAATIVARAKREAVQIAADAEVSAKERLLAREQALEKEWKARRKELSKLESEVTGKEQSLDKALAQAKERLNEITNREKKLTQREEIVDKEKREAEALLKQQRTKLEEIAGLSTTDAKAELMRQLEYDARKDATRIIKKIEENARDRAKQLARIIVTQAIEKVVPFLPVEGSVSVVRLPNEEMKGRVIGREGRNIRAFERVTGVDVIVDDTPEIIMLASHNPLRREVAKATLEKLVEDGRIHPARIEEFFEKAGEQAEEMIMNQGREALFSLGIPNMHERLVHLVGRMRMRMTQGQNLLEHSLETAKVALYMAQAVDANTEVVKRAGILHEIGHIEEHPDDANPILAAAQLARRYGEPPAVVACIQHLHPDHPSTLPEAHLLEAAENLALAAPGLHKQGLEKYIEHMDQLEQMIRGFKGVQKVYAMKAGRELLVLVDSKNVDDEYTLWLAKDIAERIEREVRFTGQIKVQVVRETRHVDFAT
jgi:ribonuclease Y